MTLDQLEIPNIDLGRLGIGDVRKILGESGLKEKTKTWLMQNERVRGIEGTYIVHGHSTSLFNIDILAEWFLYRAVSISREQAEADLNDYLDNHTDETVDTLWIFGIDIDETIELFDEVNIVPIHNMPPSHAKDIILYETYRIPPSPSVSYCALTVHFQDDSKGDSGRAVASRTRLADVALLLSLIDETSCLPHLSYTTVADKTPYGPFGGFAIQVQTQDVTIHNTKKLLRRNFNEVGNLHECFLRLSEKQKSRFRRIIDRMRQAKQRLADEDKILDLVIALEMMLLNDNDKSQLKLQFRLRGSWLISRDPEEKRENYKIFGRLYDLRSSVAHSGMLKDSDIETVREHFSRYCNLAESVCKSLLLGGTPNWNELILGIADNGNTEDENAS